LGKRTVGLAVGAIAALVVAGSALAAITFDPATGTGFVGKGDVQLVYGWNNKQAQDNASSVDFRAFSTVVSEVTWQCRNDNIGQDGQAQEKERTTTTETQGLVTTVARENSKGKDGPVTGFYLNGYEGTVSVTETTDGPKAPIYNETTGQWELQPGSCPANPSGWYLSVPPGDPVIDEEASSGGLEVTINGTIWLPIPAPPAA
jgi:hypothetical protein